MYYTYVLYSPTYDQIYVGHTSNFKLRFQQHNDGLSKSTKRFVPWELMHYEEFATRSEAMKIEKELKSNGGCAFV